MKVIFTSAGIDAARTGVWVNDFNRFIRYSSWLRPIGRKPSFLFHPSQAAVWFWSVGVTGCFNCRIGKKNDVNAVDRKQSCA